MSNPNLALSKNKLAPTDDCIKSLRQGKRLLVVNPDVSNPNPAAVLNNFLQLIFYHGRTVAAGMRSRRCNDAYSLLQRSAQLGGGERRTNGRNYCEALCRCSMTITYFHWLSYFFRIIHLSTTHNTSGCWGGEPLSALLRRG